MGNNCTEALSIQILISPKSCTWDVPSAPLQRYMTCRKLCAERPEWKPDRSPNFWNLLYKTCWLEWQSISKRGIDSKVLADYSAQNQYRIILGIKTFLFQNGMVVLEYLVNCFAGIFNKLLLFVVGHILQKHFMEIVIYFQGKIWTSLQACWKEEWKSLGRKIFQSIFC